MVIVSTTDMITTCPCGMSPVSGRISVRHLLLLLYIYFGHPFGITRSKDPIQSVFPNSLVFIFPSVLLCCLVVVLLLVPVLDREQSFECADYPQMNFYNDKVSSVLLGPLISRDGMSVELSFKNEKHHGRSSQGSGHATLPASCKGVFRFPFRSRYNLNPSTEPRNVFFPFLPHDECSFGVFWALGFIVFLSCGLVPIAPRTLYLVLVLILVLSPSCD